MSRVVARNLVLALYRLNAGDLSLGTPPPVQNSLACLIAGALGTCSPVAIPMGPRTWVSCSQFGS